MKIAVAYSMSKTVCGSTSDILITVYLVYLDRMKERKAKFLISIVQRKEPLITPGVEVVYMHLLNKGHHNGGLMVMLLLSLSSILTACMQMHCIWMDMLVMELNSL